jgi:glycosyltransferase involved in cell wall biosynthesis
MFAYILAAAMGMPAVVRRHRIEQSIVFFSLPCGPLGLYGRTLLGLPYIISVRGGDVPGTEPSLARLHKILGPLRREALKRSKAVVANSDGLKGLCEKADPVPVLVIPNGVDIDFFTCRGKKDRRPGSTKFLFVGRFREQKNLFFLLDQMNRLAYGDATPFELHLVGGGPQENALKRYAGTLAIREKIHWHSWTSKEMLRQHYHDADCLLNPSLYEGMPNVVLEAMACGLPVIASEVIGNDAVVRHGKTGFLFDLQSPEEFQRALAHFLHNKDRAIEMGQAGRSWVAKDFSWDSVAKRYAHILLHRP